MTYIICEESHYLGLFPSTTKSMMRIGDFYVAVAVHGEQPDTILFVTSLAFLYKT